MAFSASTPRHDPPVFSLVDDGDEDNGTTTGVVARRNDEHDVATAMLTLSHEKRRCHKPSPGNSLSRSLLAHAMPEEAGTVAAEVSVRYTLSKEFDTWQVGPNNFSGFF